MESLKQDLFTSFAHGTVGAMLTIEGEKAETRPEMLAHIFSYVSKGVYKKLVPSLTSAINDKKLPAGENTVEEQMKLELFGFTVTLDIKVQLTVELDAATREVLPFYVVGTIGAEVAEDIVGRLSARLKGDALDAYYEHHPEEASPFGDRNMREVLSRALDADVLQIVGMGGSAGPLH